MTETSHSLSRRQFLLQSTTALGALAIPHDLRAADLRLYEVHNVLRRLFGPTSRAFQVRMPGDTVRRNDWYQVSASDGQVQIDGSSPVALCRGAYSYLKSAGLADISWEGDRVSLPRRWPDASPLRVSTVFQHRAYMNTCTFGYTTPWWTWSRWEREIDWMAVHGIDMPLAMEGQEYVWQALWREQGLTEAELSAYFSGPAFTPWQRMGNIEGYATPLPQAWILKKHRLQKLILQRLRDLGMTPILPAFGGYVPKAFADKHPEARIYKMRAWEGFHETYWLDPADPLFAKLAGRFIGLYTETYGAGQYYLADSFNEMLPPIAKDGSDASKASYGDATANSKAVADLDPVLKAQRLADYGAAIYQSIRQANPDAVWVMQGWLFGADRAFWSSEAIGAFLSHVPDDRLMVLDIGNDRYPDVWTRAEAFKGKSWIYGYVHNYGGSNPLYGDLEFYRTDLAKISQSQETRNLKGFGVFPEGLHTNSIVYEYLYDLAWQQDQKQQDQGKQDQGNQNQGKQDQVSTKDWIATYTRARYGRTSPELLSAWTDLQAAVYQTRYWTPRWWHDTAGAYLLFKRPNITMADFGPDPGDKVRLESAVRRLVSLAPTYSHSHLFQTDLIDAIRHLTSMHVDSQLPAVIQDYLAGRLDEGDRTLARIKAVVVQVDLLLGQQQECLASWVGDARAYGETADEKAYYARIARAQVTLWGGSGNLHDYASKAWQGLYKDFYLERWIRFLKRLRQSRSDAKAFDQGQFTTEITQWESQWVDEDRHSIRRRPKVPLAVIRKLVDGLDNDPSQDLTHSHG